LFQKSLFKNDKEGFWPNDGQKRVWYIVENITAVSALEQKTNALNWFGSKQLLSQN
jgi:hypothetical protein